MFSLLSVFCVIVVYMAMLFALATRAEHRQSQLQPYYIWIYGLSLGVYHTSWGFYGNIGDAASNGFQFLALDIGAYCCVALWWILLKRMVQIKEALHITSLADLIAARYSSSRIIAAVVAIICLLGSIPYIGLQIKAVMESVSVISAEPAGNGSDELIGIGSSAVLLLFTILYGIRRLDPTEHHYGMLVVLALECMIKLLVIIGVGAFITFGLYDGFGDIFQRLEQSDQQIFGLGPETRRTSSLISLFVIGFFAVIMLPRQFHIAVVENNAQSHIRPAAIILCLYMFLFSVFVVPVAGAGLLQGVAPEQADMTLLIVPMQNGYPILTLLTFIGGFAAASGMVIITTTTVATMVSNHLILPVAEHYPALSWIRGYLLPARRIVALIVIGSAYLFIAGLKGSFLLVGIGTLAITALLQIVPAMFGGLFWQRGNTRAALISMLSGMLIWLYVLLLPFLIPGSAILTDGPFGQIWLSPENFFALGDIGLTARGMLASLGINTLLYIAISLLSQPEPEEQTLTAKFMGIFGATPAMRQVRPTGLDDYISLQAKHTEALQLLSRYLRRGKAQNVLELIEEDLHIRNKKEINIIELVEYHRMIESELAGSIGAASSHNAIKTHVQYSNRESNELQAVFHHISSELQAAEGGKSSAEKDKTIDVLHTQIAELEKTISQQQSQIEQLQNRLDQRYQEIHDFRLQAQKFKAELDQHKSATDTQQLAELEQENNQLKRMYAELCLQQDQNGRQNQP